MPSAELRELLDQLPTPVRDQLAGFSVYAEDRAPELFASLDRPDADSTLLHNFLLLAFAWRLWRAVDGQYALLSGALGLLAPFDAVGFQLGSALYTRGSPPTIVLSELRSSLLATLSRAGIAQVAALTSLNEVAQYTIELTDGH